MPSTVAPHHDTARKNNAGGAKFLPHESEHPFAVGTFRFVGKGKYTSGRRKGQPCVLKWLRTGHVSSQSVFGYDIKASETALEIIRKFNHANIIEEHIRINIPEVWDMTSSSERHDGKKVLIEPFIEGFSKWNSNTGWNDTKFRWGRIMQAVSHYSYHISNRELLLCDLQGGFYPNGAVVTDPVICSKSDSYGPTDMGRRGIYNFFAHHRCNEFCRGYWYKPHRARAAFEPRQSTTMVNARLGRVI